MSKDAKETVSSKGEVEVNKDKEEDETVANKEGAPTKLAVKPKSEGGEGCGRGGEG